MTIRISKSKILCYDSCPLRYKFHYINGLKSPPNRYMIKGIDIHDALDVFYTAGKKSEKYADIIDWVDKEMGKPLTTEQTITLKYKGVDFICILDRIEKDYAVMDYKTGAYKSLNSYNFELAMYSMATRIEYNINRELEAGVIYTKDRKIKKKLITNKDIDDMFIHVLDVINKIENEEFEPNSKGCYFCAYKNKCWQRNRLL